jgi:hypothetical protein
MNRLRPVIFFSSVEAALSADLGRLAGLTIDHGRARLRVAAGRNAVLNAEGRIDPGPGAAEDPQIVVVPHGIRIGKIMGQQAPLTASAEQIEHGVDDLAQGHRPGAASPGGAGQQGRDQLPLSIG